MEVEGADPDFPRYILKRGDFLRLVDQTASLAYNLGVALLLTGLVRTASLARAESGTLSRLTAKMEGHVLAQCEARRAAGAAIYARGLNAVEEPTVECTVAPVNGSVAIVIG